MKTSKRELHAAMLTFAVGVLCLYSGLLYGVGTLTETDSGSYPFLLGVVLIILSILLLIMPAERRNVDEDHEEAQSLWIRLKRYRPWLFITISVIGFVILNQYGGFVAATLFLLLCSGFADPKNSFMTVVSIGALATIASVLIFYYGLNLPLTLFTWG